MNWNNPYPGPRPLTDGQVLFGRAKEVDDLAQQVHERRVVELTAVSGAGKTSLLAAGLLPRLHDRFGKCCLQVTDWSWTAEVAAKVRGSGQPDALAESLFADVIRRASGARLTSLERREGAQPASDDIDRLRAIATVSRMYPDPLDFLDAVEDEIGSGLVIVHDQFEELLRAEPRLGRIVLGTIGEMAKEFSFRQIVSMRSEYKHETRYIEERLNISDWTWRTLEPVADVSAIEGIVCVGDGLGWLTPDAAAHVVESFRRERSGSSDVGLVHLQALLWVLCERWIREASATPLAASDIRGHAADWQADNARHADRGARQRDAGMYELSLHEYLLERLGLPEETRDLNRRRVLHLAATGVAHLSSAGYKTQQHATELCLLSAPGLQRACGLGPTEVEGALAEATRTTSQSEVAAAVSTKFVGTAPALDRKSGSAGTLFGEPAIEVLARTAVDFETMLSLLQHEHLVRITPTSRGRSVALVHDTYGEQFNRWAERARRSGLAPVDSSTEVVAVELFEHYKRDREPDGNPGRVFDQKVLEAAGIPPCLSGLRWVSCIVERVTFAGITFLGSSLSATYFEDCRFRDVDFYECDLRGTLFIGCEFENCRIVGALDDPRFNEPALRSRQLSSLVLRSCTATGDAGLEVNGLHGTGLFLETFQGTLTVRNSNIAHVRVNVPTDDNGEALGEARLVVEDARLDHVGIEAGVTLDMGADGQVQWFDGPDEAVTGDTSACRRDGTKTHLARANLGPLPPVRHDL